MNYHSDPNLPKRRPEKSLDLQKAIAEVRGMMEKKECTESPEILAIIEQIRRYLEWDIGIESIQNPQLPNEKPIDRLSEPDFDDLLKEWDIDVLSEQRCLQNWQDFSASSSFPPFIARIIALQREDQPTFKSLVKILRMYSVMGKKILQLVGARIKIGNRFKN